MVSAIVSALCIAFLVYGVWLVFSQLLHEAQYSSADAAAAVTNAVFHATGRRVRDLPIMLDKLL